VFKLRFVLCRAQLLMRLTAVDENWKDYSEGDDIVGIGQGPESGP